MLEEFLVPLETSCVYYDPGFLDDDEASKCYETLLSQTNWEKTAKINRWVCLCQKQGEGSNAFSGGEAEPYKYRDAPGEAIRGFPPAVQEIQTKVSEWYKRQTGKSIDFNVCLLNFYEDGQHRIGWHSDREEIGRDTPIISISLGATRSFMIRSKMNGVRDRVTVPLEPGSLIMMENVCQMDYVHSIPRQSEVTNGRINLTFRFKKEGTAGEEEHERRDNWLDNIVEGVNPSQKPWTLSLEDSSKGSAIFGSDAATVQVPSPIRYLVKTNLGAENYAAAEISELLPKGWDAVARPLELDGYAAVCTSDEEPSPVEGLLLQLRSAHHVLRYHTHYHIEECCTNEFPTPRVVDGERLYQHFKRQLVDGKISINCLQSAKSFRVTSERIGGPHEFRAPEIEREIGGAISEYYTECKPRMEDYDVNIRADITGYIVTVGTQLNVHDLSKGRHFTRYRNLVTIKINIAYAMIRCANISKGACIADPFCGSGTILLEALEVYEKKIQCIGIDVSRRGVEGARENAAASDCSECCKFACSDARSLRKHLADESQDAIISNLPWGIRTGSKDVTDLQTIYEVFLRTAWYALKPGARVVLFVLRGLQVVRIARKLSGRYRLLSVNVVRTSGNLPSIVVLEKLAEDHVREAVKGQLAHLNQYTDISTEIYAAIHMENIN